MKNFNCISSSITRTWLILNFTCSFCWCENADTITQLLFHHLHNQGCAVSSQRIDSFQELILGKESIRGKESILTLKQLLQEKNRFMYQQVRLAKWIDSRFLRVGIDWTLVSIWPRFQVDTREEENRHLMARLAAAETKLIEADRKVEALGSLQGACWAWACTKS